MASMYKHSSKNIEMDSNTILKCAAQLIKSEIRDMSCDNTYYPSATDVTGKWVPER